MDGKHVLELEATRKISAAEMKAILLARLSHTSPPFSKVMRPEALLCRRPSSFWAPIAAGWHRGVTSQSTMSTPTQPAPRKLVSIDSNGVFDEPKLVALFSCVRPVAALHTKEIV